MQDWYDLSCTVYQYPISLRREDKHARTNSFYTKPILFLTPADIELYFYSYASTSRTVRREALRAGMKLARALKSRTTTSHSQRPGIE